jgi:molecular chaperone DnaK (HSP70)
MRPCCGPSSLLMKLGIDFGTTRIVVAAVDRGNYPLVSFDAGDGTTADWYPSLVAIKGDERCYGWEAWHSQLEDGWTVIRSVKRLLDDAGPRTVIAVGDQQVPLYELLTGLTGALRIALTEASNLHLKPGEPFEIVLGVPANANSNQRFLTVDSFRAAGFEVLGVLNEPSAASIEFGHRERHKRIPQTMLVYDLGGGTFDASLVVLDGNVHHVVASEGIATIGGDDFDQLLADLALEKVAGDGEPRENISPAAWFHLLEECRCEKESLNQNSRRISVDLEHLQPGLPPVQVSAAEFYERARPLVEETIAATEDLLSHFGEGDFDVLYVTGGGSELPVVARALRERFGRRVRRSAYTRSATAIGLAIHADQPGSHQLDEKLSRYFGVWREAESGSRIVFDPLFEKGLKVPAAGEPPLAIERTYSPVHNIGHFRFLECSHRGEDGSPSGDITVWDEIRFPFDPMLQSAKTLTDTPVRPLGETPQDIQELYTCDSSGAIAATISNRSAGYARTYPLGRWSAEVKQVAPVRRKKKS